MSERDDIDDLLEDLAETLDALQRELPAGELAPRPPRPPGLPRRDRKRGRRSRPVRDTARTGDTGRTGDGDRDRERSRSRRRRRSDPGAGPRSQRIPGPREFLQFTEEYTIPTLIAMLEATIKSLELLRAILRVAGGRGLHDPTGSGRSGRSGRSRSREVVGEAGRRALDSLDTVLEDLQDAVEGQPTDPRARDLLGEARDLRAEIDDMIAGRSPVGGDEDGDAADAADAADGHAGYGDDAASRSGASERRTEGITIDVADGSTQATDEDASAGDPDDADADDAGVDVDAELDTIKQEMGKTDEAAGGDDIEAGNGGDGDSNGDSNGESDGDSNDAP